MKIQNKNKRDIKIVLEERLALQSIQRELNIYKLPAAPRNNFNLEYFKSKQFKELFNRWDNFTKDKFLKVLAGNYSKNAEDFINN